VRSWLAHAWQTDRAQGVQALVACLPGAAKRREYGTVVACTNFHRVYYAEPLRCELHVGQQVIGTPKMGCVFWECEPGSNDD